MNIAPPRRRTHAPERDPAEQPLALIVGRAIWENLPNLLVIDLCFALAVMPALLVSAAGGLLAAPLLLAVGVGPVWLAALAAGEAILDGEIVSARRMFGMLRVHAKRGVALALIPSAIVTILLGTLQLAGNGEQRRWMLAPLAVDALALSLVVIVGLGAGWLAARGNALNRDLMRRGALLAGSAPQVIGGMIAVLVLIAVSVQLIGPLMAIILAAPFALFACACFRWVVATRWTDGHA
jgi:hypothetical protein